MTLDEEQQAFSPLAKSSPCGLCRAPWYDLHAKGCPDRGGIDWGLWFAVTAQLLAVALAAGIYGWLTFFAGRA